MKSSYCIHFEERNNIFYSFCNDCKMNLCLECEQSHKKHTIFKFDDIFPSPSDCVISKKEKLDELKEKIDNIFIENNKNKCKMIINNKESELMEECFLGSNDNEIILLNIKQITDMSYMFYNCTSLLEIYGIDKWDTSSVTNMSNLFYYCNNLKNLPDISKWNTKNVINMNNMFSGCKFTSLPDISLWDTSSVTNMSYMFFDCKNINQLPDISKWNISKVNNLSHMFHNCESLKEIPLLDNWDLRSVVDISYMFYNCANISGHINLQQWNLSNITCKDNIFDGCPQSFIDNLNSVNGTQNNPNDKNNCLIV